MSDNEQVATLLADRARSRAAHAVSECERIGELEMYLTHRAEWITQSAPKTVALMARWGDTEALQTWRCIGMDYKRAMWALMDVTQRERIKLLVKPA